MTTPQGLLSYESIPTRTQLLQMPWTCDGHSSLHPAAFAMDLLDIVVPHFSATSTRSLPCPGVETVSRTQMISVWSPTWKRQASLHGEVLHGEVLHDSWTPPCPWESLAARLVAKLVAKVGARVVAKLVAKLVGRLVAWLVAISWARKDVVARGFCLQRPVDLGAHPQTSAILDAVPPNVPQTARMHSAAAARAAVMP